MTDQVNQPSHQPPPGQTWDGTVEDVSDRLLGESTQIASVYANALGAIGALVRGRDTTFGGLTAEQKFALIDRVLDGLDHAEQQLQLRQGGEQA